VWGLGGGGGGKEKGGGGRAEKGGRRGGRVGPAQKKHEQPNRRTGGRQQAWQAGRPFVVTQRRDGTGRKPIEQRRLVKEGQRIERWNKPVAGAYHFPGHADVAAFVWQGQGTHPGGRCQPGI